MDSDTSNISVKSHIWMPLAYDAKTKKITGILSNTSLDRDDESMSNELILSYKTQIEETGSLPILKDHSNSMDSLVGFWKNPELIEGNGRVALRCEPEFFSADASPEAAKVKVKIEESAKLGGNIGVSIGARPLKSHEDVIDGVKQIVWDEAELLEASFVPIPSNRFAFAEIAKGVRAEDKKNVTVGDDVKKKMKKQAENGEEEEKQPENGEEENEEKNVEEAVAEMASQLAALSARVDALEGSKQEDEEETIEEQEDDENVEEKQEESEEEKAAEDNDAEPEEPHEDTGEAGNDAGVGVLEEGGTATPAEITDLEDQDQVTGKETVIELKKKVDALQKELDKPVYKGLLEVGKLEKQKEEVFSAGKAMQMLTKGKI